MKMLYIIVEGQTEQEFVNTILAPYFRARSILFVTPKLINTSRIGRGGLSNYQHLKNTIEGVLKSCKDNNDIIVTTLIDFFRIPKNMPQYNSCIASSTRLEQVKSLEEALQSDINDRRFIPYIQLHELEALLFSSDTGFKSYFNSKELKSVSEIISEYINPEDINSTPEGAPSKRLIKIKSNYNKVIEGNLIALEVGIDSMLKSCPRFRGWVELLLIECSN